MALFSELTTKIKADNSDFIKKVNDSKNSLKGFVQNTAKLGAIATGVVAGTAALAFGTLLNVINDTTEEISRLVDTANRLGGSVAGFQKLEYAAKLADVSTSELNQGLRKMSQTLIAANNGSEKAEQAFKQLGVSTKELSKLSIDQQYVKLADAFSKINDKAKQTELAFAIFGKSGMTQLTLLRDNLNETFADFDKFGAALTDKQAGAVESYGDSLDRLSAIFSAFKIQLTAAVAPALEIFVKWIGDSIIQMGGLGEVGKQTGVFIVDGILLGVQAFQGLLNLIDSVVNKFKQLKLEALEIAQTFNTLGFALTGGDVNFERGLEIAKLKRDLNTKNTSSNFTSGLQSGLQNARNALTGGSSQKATIDVKISAADGFKADVAESPEVTKAINLMVRQSMAKEATSVGS